MRHIRTAVALVATGAAIAGAVVGPQAAFAASADKTLNRAHCTYKFHSTKTWAYSEKYSGDCSGHAYLRVKDNLGRTSDWIHSASFIDWVADGYTFVWTEHKSQSNETPWHNNL